MHTEGNTTISDRELARIIWDYMRYEQPLEKTDVIIGLGCHDIGVARHSAKLYNEGYAPVLLFCGGTGRLTPEDITNEADWFANEAMRCGVPDGAILRERGSTNTGENIRFGSKLLQEAGISVAKAIVVHKPYMLRRDYATIMKQWPGGSPPVCIFSAEEGTFDDYIDKIEPFDETVSIMVGDLQRIREYPKQGFQIELDIPDEVWTAYEILVSRGYDTHLLK